MGESNREDPPPPEPSLGDLIKSDEFQRKLDAAREKRARIQADRAKSGRPGKLRPGRPATPPESGTPDTGRPEPSGPGGRRPAPPDRTPAPMVLGENRRVRKTAADLVPLTPGMRILAGTDSERQTADPAGSSRTAKSSVWRTLLTSIAGIVIGFAAGAIAMDLAGREVSLPLSGVLGGGGETEETATIRPARNFDLMAEAPARPEPAGTEPAGGLPTPAAPLVVPPAPANGSGAEPPDFATTPPDPPFAGQAAGARIAVFGPEGSPLDVLTRRLDSLGVTEVETRPVDLAMDRTVIRYYREGDASLARNLAAALDATLQNLTSFRPQPTDPRIEIWPGGV